MQTFTTLLDLLREIARLDNRHALKYHNGYRTFRHSYRQLYGGIGGMVRELERRNIGRGDKVLLWGDNRAEWLMTFWACLARGAIVVPLDVRMSAAITRRIQEDVEAKILVCSDGVAAGALDLPALFFHDITGLPPNTDFIPAPAQPEDIVEIVYTSGTTGDPKGVVHRHKNICANLLTVQKLFNKYKRITQYLPQLSTLNLLPLSHMFGQTMSLFLPVMIEGSVVFMRELHPTAVIACIKREKLTTLVTVPHLLENLRNEVIRRIDLPPEPPDKPGLMGLVRRIWTYRRVHRIFGWRFWFMVIGGSEVKPDLEHFWNWKGFNVIQGYGLTETSPVIAFNTPLNTTSGSLGEVIEGMEVRIAPDGEILVRGDSVVSEYYHSSEPVIQDGWFHTGDIGTLDAGNHLYYRGRKKDVIVTADGLNVHPQDVEDQLNAQPEIRASAVVAVQRQGQEAVHAAIIPESPQSDCEAVVQRVNQTLEPHQRIRSWTLWPEDDFPRTTSTFKIRRVEVAARVAGESGPELEQTEETDARHTLARMAGRNVSELHDAMKLREEIGLSSLEWVEYLSAMENRYNVPLDEEAFTSINTVGELMAWVERPAAPAPPKSAPAGSHTALDSPDKPDTAMPAAAGAAPVRADVHFPRWTGFPPLRWIRRILFSGIIFPWMRHYVRLEVLGLEHLDQLEGPVFFAANHTSHLDTPAILMALPPRWRRRVAPAMRQDYFDAWMNPEGHPFHIRLLRGMQFYLACGMLNAYPLPQEVHGMRRTLLFTGELIDRGNCPLVYPEGHRTEDGTLQPFMSGISLMAGKLGVPIVPVYLDGMFAISRIHQMWPKKGNLRIIFGPPIYVREHQHHDKGREVVEAAMRTMAGERKHT